jgi:hypothetical protein
MPKMLPPRRDWSAVPKTPRDAADHGRSSDQRRVTSEAGQFVAWSPDGRYLLVSGRALYVVRPDGTGRLELRTDGIAHALGGIPGWR